MGMGMRVVSEGSEICKGVVPILLIYSHRQVLR